MAGCYGLEPAGVGSLRQSEDELPLDFQHLADTFQDVIRRGDLVLDAFLGSGASLIAAERTSCHITHRRGPPTAVLDTRTGAGVASARTEWGTLGVDETGTARLSRTARPVLQQLAATRRGTRRSPSRGVVGPSRPGRRSPAA